MGSGNGNGRQMQPREWAVFGGLDPVAVYPKGHRDEGEPFRLPVDPDEVERMSADLATMQRLIGGTLTSAPDREINPFTGFWETTAMYWQWHAFAPTSQAQKAPKRAKRGDGQPAEPAPARDQPSAAAAAAELEPPDEDLEDDGDYLPLSEEEQRAVDAELAEEPA